MVYFPHTLLHVLMKIPRDGGAHECTRNPITVKFFTQIGFIYPFTRAIDRLLGPCFKTGPKGIPNLTVVDRVHNHSHVWVMRTSMLQPLKSIRQL